MRCYIRHQEYQLGEYKEINIFPVYKKNGASRREKRNPTPETQKRLNERNSIRRLVRLAHLNFGPEDLFIRRLSYRDDCLPASVDEANKQVRNFLRRLARLRKKKGLPPLKYIWVTEAGEKTGRIHHHMLVNGGIDRDEIEQLWGLGYANTERLEFSPEGIGCVGFYMGKAPLSKKRYNVSRNLTKPAPQNSDFKLSQRKLKELKDNLTDRGYIEALYPGYTPGSEPILQHNELTGEDYIYLWLVKKDARCFRRKRRL